MIDFRYHLVSLISVFLALSVGIILGAGPLQEEIGAQLQDQVEQLRVERNEIRTQLESAKSASEQAQSYIDEASEHMVPGSLSGQTVAIIRLDDSVANRDEAIAQQLTRAGAETVAEATLSTRWTASDGERDRKTVASGLADLLPPGDATMTPEQRLSQALAVAVTSSDPAATQLMDQLEQFGLVKWQKKPEKSANMVLFVSGSSSAPGAPSPTSSPLTQLSDSALAIQLDVVAALGDAATAVVVAGPTVTSHDLISVVRSDDSIRRSVSTVSGIETQTGMINIPLGLAAEQSGQWGHYGFDEKATATIPPPSTPASPR